MINKFDVLCVDLQNDFASTGGKNYNMGKSSDFIKETLFPLLLNRKIKVSEIISDYRLPRGKSKNESCVPGTWGYESILPQELKKGHAWIKCMHNPLWIRDNIGIENCQIGVPYQDPMKFDKWLSQNLNTKKVVLFGLTTECCILQVASELYFRGFDVYCIYEATDPMNERLNHKDEIAFFSTFALYTKMIHFDEFISMLEE